MRRDFDVLNEFEGKYFLKFTLTNNNLEVS